MSTLKFNGPDTPCGALQPGQLFQGRYLIIGKIGQGGMGHVYQARDTHFAHVHRLCAVKAMVNMTTDRDLRDQMMRNFEREAEILATLSHPAIPQIFDYFRFGDCAYLVQEFIQGRDLEAILGSVDAFLPPEQVRTWGIELCDVLDYLHNHQPDQIVFRDMKPSNVMIDQHRSVRLIDFGIARTLQVNSKVTAVGTQGYAAPEMYGGEVDACSDVYSLGATLHHLLTRADPQRERPFSFEERPILAANPAAPAGLVAAVMRALTYERDQRYASALDMKKALCGAESLPTRTLDDPQAAITRPHDPERRTAPAPAILRDDPAQCLWSFGTEDAVRTRPLIYQGAVYVGSHDNNLWALDAADGSLKWKYATGGPVTGSASYSGGAICVGSGDAHLYALDPRTGNHLWQFKTGGAIHTRPASGSGLVFVGSNDGRLYAVKPGLSQAKKVWEYDFLTPIHSSPAVENGRVYFGSDGGEMACVDHSGAEVWRFTGRRRILSSPVIKGGQIYLGANDQYVYALEVDHPLINWSFRTRGEVVASAGCGDGRIFIGSSDGFLYALDTATGHEIWHKNLGRPVMSSPAVAGNTVYFGAMDGMVYALNANSGDVVWRFQTDGPVISSPSVADGIVYVGSDDHHVYALLA